jgi:Zn-dependent protease
MQELTLVQQLAALALPLIFAVTLHEAAHGWMARRLGDPTAEMLGRVTLNPLRHIDLLGTLVVPTLMYLTTHFLFGWAKPVPVTWQNLRKPGRDMALVAAAGPGANLLMALFWAIVAKTGYALEGASHWLSGPLMEMGKLGIWINAILMVLNLLPILPLDGGRILAAALPPRVSARFARLEPWGIFIVVGLLLTGILGAVLGPVLRGVVGMIAVLAQLGA